MKPVRVHLQTGKPSSVLSGVMLNIVAEVFAKQAVQQNAVLRAQMEAMGVPLPDEPTPTEEEMLKTVMDLMTRKKT